jgi:DNA-binding IclR family transcriptional regulator
MDFIEEQAAVFTFLHLPHHRSELMAWIDRAAHPGELAAALEAAQNLSETLHGQLSPCARPRVLRIAQQCCILIIAVTFSSVSIRTYLEDRVALQRNSVKRRKRRDRDQRATTRPGTVLAVRRAMELMNLLSGVTQPVGVTEIASKIGLHKSSVSRLLSTLERGKLVERDLSSGRFHLGIGVIALAAPLLNSLKVVEFARPYLQELAQRSGETINLSIWNGQEAVSIEQVLGANAIMHFAPPGRRNPAHATASGKAFLAHAPSRELDEILRRPLEPFTDRTIASPAALLRELEQIRAQGYATNDGEFVKEVSAVSTVIRNVRGEIVAVITATVPSFRFKRERRREIIEMVTRAAYELSSRLGYSAPLPSS